MPPKLRKAFHPPASRGAARAAAAVAQTQRSQTRPRLLQHQDRTDPPRQRERRLRLRRLSCHPHALQRDVVHHGQRRGCRASWKTAWSFASRCPRSETEGVVGAAETRPRRRTALAEGFAGIPDHPEMDSRARELTDGPNLSPTPVFGGPFNRASQHSVGQAIVFRGLPGCAAAVARLFNCRPLRHEYLTSVQRASKPSRARIFLPSAMPLPL